MSDLFVYGTLCHIPHLTVVLGRDPGDLTEAQLANHAAYWVKGEPFPMIQQEQGATTSGFLLRNLTAEDMERLDFYEGGYAFDLVSVLVTSGTGVQTARVYRPQPGRFEKGAPWDFEAWLAEWSQIAVNTADEVMARRGDWTMEQIRRVLPFFRARGWARQMGQEDTPTELRAPMESADVEVRYQDGGWNGFFRLRPFQVRHRRFDGAMSEWMSRECFVAYDAALILPYDPKTDRVMLVEQLRFGTLMRGDPNPRVLEPIAGLVDAGEDPRETARREAVEEAGLALDDIRPIAGSYSSPGYSTEYFHTYLGVCELAEIGTGHGGLASENEDIRTHVMSFDAAMALVDSGEINVTPLVMMLLWLARQRESLRAAA